jgi:hypothetical protein
MIFWLVLKLEISYRVIIYLEGFWFLLENFLKIIFLHSEIFEFPQFFFCLKIFFNLNGKAKVWHTPLFAFGSDFSVLSLFFLSHFAGCFVLLEFVRGFHHQWRVETKLKNLTTGMVLYVLENGPRAHWAGSPSDLHNQAHRTRSRQLSRPIVWVCRGGK